ncbi:MAG: GspE/PulE family protein [Planctomycetota bacterium]|nr:GspE/PulE family protein [Planctomycetota bacterium]RLS24271.1 MAG: type II/IV secretion system protein [Planctomycetota bacterium]
MTQANQQAVLKQRFQDQIGSLFGLKTAPEVPAIVDAVLAEAFMLGASDAHLTPSAHGLRVSWRLDGVLHPVGVIPQPLSAPVVARLKVLAGLLTYRLDVPQEGRIPGNSATNRREIRISTFPTLHGERAALRFVESSGRREVLSQIGLPESILQSVSQALDWTSGMVVITGPAGSGKTTTLYACLREIVSRSEQSRGVVSLEDPIESALEGVAQTALEARAGLGLAELVKAVLRQDPDVIAIGEIRDRPTAESAFQAALTGHLVLTTTHAGDSVEVLTRLMDMRIAPYIIKSGLRAILAQRLLRKLCCVCRVEADQKSSQVGDLGTGLDQWFEPAMEGCSACRHTGYDGRLMIAEWLELGDNSVGRALASRRDARPLRRLVEKSGAQTLMKDAIDRAKAGDTSPLEIRRVLGSGRF